MRTTLPVLLLLAAVACEATTAWHGAQLLGVEPQAIAPFAAEPLEISGKNLFGVLASGVERDNVQTNYGYSGRLGGVALTGLTRESNVLLRATAPALDEGVYDLEIETPRRELLVLERAVMVTADVTAGGGHGEVEAMHGATETFDPGDIVVDVPLSPAVVPERSVLFFNLRHDSLAPHDGQMSGQIVDGGKTVRFRRHGTGVGIEVAWTVLQHTDLVVQRGSALHPSSPTTVTLDTPVTLASSFVIATLCISGGSYNWNDWVRAELTDPSTLTLSSGIDEQNPNATVEWQVVSFSPEANAVVQRVPVDLGVGDFEDVRPAGGVPEDRTLLVFSQHSIQSLNVAAHNQVRGRLDAGELRFDRSGADIDIEITAYLVTWPALSVEHGTLYFSADEYRRRAALERCPDSGAAVVSFLPAGLRQGRSARDWDDGVGAGWFTSVVDGCDVVLERGAVGAEADAAWTVFWFE